jgi:hypothetical protein
MVLQNAKLQRELFTLEELNRIEPLILEGNYENIMVMLDECTPEKEIELQRIINYLKPLSFGFESEVKKQMEEVLPNGPQTPEEEAEWEAKLQTEFKEYANKQKERRGMQEEATEEVLDKKETKPRARRATNKSKKEVNKLKEEVIEPVVEPVIEDETK